MNGNRVGEHDVGRPRGELEPGLRPLRLGDGDRAVQDPLGRTVAIKALKSEGKPVKKADGGAISGDDLIIEERPL